jgi:glyoxylase-like metal-dependent hydrolase (beta-lactamase superfamily II)
MFAPGHTPGHMCVAVTAGREMAIYVGDLLHHEAQLDHAHWSPLFDMLPRMSASSRQRVLAEAQRQRAVLISAHLPTPGIARPDADGWTI